MVIAKLRWLVVLLCLSPAVAYAEMERTAIPGGGGMQLYIWPAIAPPKGWHQDKTQSYQTGTNAFAPDGATFVNAETVMYARAIPKSQVPHLKTLDEFIASDVHDFAKQGVDAKEATLLNITGRSFRSLIFAPKAKGNWERVAYGEEDGFYVLFSISSRSKSGFESSMRTYEDWVSTYR
jgi:hypothetical protein